MTSGAEDDLDQPSWDAILESVVAAHSGDAEGHVAPLLRYERLYPANTLAARYLWYLLRRRAAMVIGRVPTQDDLHALALRFAEKFSLLIINGPSRLEDTLMTVFEFADHDQKVRGGDAVVWGSAALGVMLDSPRADMQRMRAGLAQWAKQFTTA